MFTLNYARDSITHSVVKSKNYIQLSKLMCTEEFGDRLDKALDAVDFPSHQKGRKRFLAKRLGISKAAVVLWYNGVGMPRYKNMLALCETFGFSPVWLQTGEGPMMAEDAKHHDFRSEEDKEPLDYRQVQLVQQLKRLNDDDYETAMRTFELLLNRFLADHDTYPDEGKR